MIIDNKNKHLADNAQVALENHRREQEERKLAMMREQKTRELKQLENQLFYKKQEVARLKSLHERLRRESVARQSTKAKETHEAEAQERLLKETEVRIKELEHAIQVKLGDITDRIDKEKAVILEHQRVLENLEKQKRETEGKRDLGKRTLMESISRIIFFKKKEERDVQNIQRLMESNEQQFKQIESSLKAFSQEVTVLENKIRTLNTALK